jgi:hypothetical protein
MAAANLPVHALIGSNEGETLKDHVAQLVSYMGLPRTNGWLGIVSYAGAYFHPKCYHIRRSDGSQAAYVGSANLTLPGISAQHIEAGVIVDTLDGDASTVLDDIADCVDVWFQRCPPGFNRVTDVSDVDRLTASGLLALVPPPRPTSSLGNGTASGIARPRLQPLVSFPRLASTARPAPAATAAAAASAASGTPSPTSTPPATSPVTASIFSSSVIAPVSVPQNPPYPPYLLFAPGVTVPTVGSAALSGATLPGGNVGLIIRLNRDSSRHWSGGAGTANISVPVPTLSTLRFGIFDRGRARPRCEFPIEMRFLYPGSVLQVEPADTNIMAYGFSPGDTGHGDVRMVVPKPPASLIAELIGIHGRSGPGDGDFAFLEWPTAIHPTFRLSLLERDSPIFQQASRIFYASQAVGGGACWLPPSISPSW